MTSASFEAGESDRTVRKKGEKRRREKKGGGKKIGPKNLGQILRFGKKRDPLREKKRRGEGEGGEEEERAPRAQSPNSSIETPLHKEEEGRGGKETHRMPWMLRTRCTREEKLCLSICGWRKRGREKRW